MRRPAHSSLSSCVGLLSAMAACGGGQGGLVTVGVRPTDAGAAQGGTAAGGASRLPIPGTEVMNQIPDLDPTPTPGPDAAGVPGAAMAGMTAVGRGGAGAARAGAGGAQLAAAGAGGASGAPGASEDECGVIPSQPAGKVTSGRVSSSGMVEYDVKAASTFTALRTTVAVPAEPASNGAIFIWPGIQPTPTAINLQPIGNGALLPVLTWGPLCIPDAPPSYSTWSIAPMYSNLSSSDPQYAGCHGGKATLAEPRQLVDIEIHLEGTKWVEKVVNRDTLAMSDFSLDLKGQAQGRAFFVIELPSSSKPTEDIVFTNTVLSLDMSDPSACQPVLRGSNDFASKPRVSSDGKHCCIDRIVLRASGVMATTVDPN